MEKITCSMLNEQIAACPHVLEKGRPRFDALNQRLIETYGQEYAFDPQALTRLEQWTGLNVRGEVLV